MTELDEGDKRHLEEYQRELQELATWVDCDITRTRIESVNNCIAMIEAKQNG